jgi:hypothetical protein
VEERKNIAGAKEGQAIASGEPGWQDGL